MCVILRTHLLYQVVDHVWSTLDLLLLQEIMQRFACYCLFFHVFPWFVGPHSHSVDTLSLLRIKTKDYFVTDILRNTKY